MTKAECERKLLDLLEQAFKVYKEYNPDARHLSAYCINGQCSAIGFIGNGDEKDIDAIKFPDGATLIDGHYDFKEAV